MAISGSSSSRPKPDSAGAELWRRLTFRIVAVADIAAGALYIGWRYAASLNAGALALAILLVLAESYGLLDSFLYAATMWKPRRRSPQPPLEGASVDVFITTYNEPLEIVRATARAAVAIDWSPLAVYILDDGARAEMRELAASLGCGYVTRGEEWRGKDRHAKAGNVNNALAMTTGEFILILDADQIPDPRIVRRTVGYFSDPGLAFVQTPQSFYNIPPGDPFGSDAPLFYGPIMRGKDGWNAAFFCGSNAILRREALMQVGLAAYAEAAEAEFRASLARYRRESRGPAGGRAARERRRALRKALREAERSLDEGAPLQAVSAELKRKVAACGDEAPGAEGLAARAFALCADDFGLARKEEALAVEGVSTVSVTEDMATALRLHASGWRSAFHSEVLAYGLAPEDLGSSLAQRLRWAQGTIQVLLRDSPLKKRGLSRGQRLMYFATIYSYFSGFANLVFVACPVLFLFFGLTPVKAWSLEFFARFLPFFLLNRCMFLIAAEGLGVKRGEQYNLGLFPLWIKAVLGVVTGRKISFSVTPKTRQSGNYLPLLKPQLAAIALTAAGIAFAAFGFATGRRADLLGALVNAFWGCYNIAQFLVIVRAARYAPPEGWNPGPPRLGEEERSERA